MYSPPCHNRQLICLIRYQRFVIGTRLLANSPICACKHEWVSKLSTCELYRIFRNRLRNSIMKSCGWTNESVCLALCVVFKENQPKEEQKEQKESSIDRLWVFGILKRYKSRNDEVDFSSETLNFMKKIDGTLLKGSLYKTKSATGWNGGAKY